MGADVINVQRGSKPHSLDLAALSANEWIIWDTMELVAFFGIPDGMHLVFDLITMSSPAADANNLIVFAADFVDDDTEDPRADLGLVSDIMTRTGRGVWFHIINAANTAVAMTPVDIYNTFALADVDGNTDSVITFWFHYEDGPMDWTQEQREAQIERRQIEALQGSQGDQYFQIDGTRNQVFIGGV